MASAARRFGEGLTLRRLISSVVPSVLFGMMLLVRWEKKREPLKSPFILPSLERHCGARSLRFLPVATYLPTVPLPHLYSPEAEG